MQCLAQVLGCDCCGTVKACGVLEQVERCARIAVGVVGEEANGVIFDIDVERVNAAGDDLLDLVNIEWAQREDLHPRQQRRYDLEAGVFRGGADERERAVFDIRQEEILLRFVEAVDLVEKEDGAVGPFFFGWRGEETQLAAAISAWRLDRCDDLTQFRFAGGDSREVIEGLFGDLGDHAREGGLADTGRPPEYHARHRLLLQSAVEWLADADEMGLTDEAAEITRTDAFR